MKTLSEAALLNLVTINAQQGYAAAAASETRITRTVNLGKGPKAKAERHEAAKVARQGSAPSGNGTEPKVAPPARPLLLRNGSLTAPQFLTMIRDAGKRPAKDGGGMERRGKDGQAIYMVDALARRDDEAVACSGFLGYDFFGIHGVQLEVARRKAGFIMTGGSAASMPYTRAGSAAVVAGFVAGMPDDKRKVIMDLLAREDLAAAKLAARELQSEDVDLDEATRQFAYAESRLEAERILAIRDELKLHGVAMPERPLANEVMADEPAE